MNTTVSRPAPYGANLSVGNILTAQPFSYALSPLIGPPTTSLQVQPGYNIRKEFTTVAENHEGRVEHLAVFLGNLFAETENSFVFSLFALRQFGDQNWMTSTWVFDSYIAQETPSQSPPPLGSYRKNRASGTLTRYAFGVQTLLDTLKDPDGDMIYFAMTVQCLQSFVRAMEALVLTAMVNTRAQYLKFWVEASDFTVDLKSRAATENATFDALHRYPDAVAKLHDLVQNAFDGSQRGRATAVIVHQGFRALAAASPALNNFYLRGEGNKDFADRRSEAVGLAGKLLGTDVDVYVASPINATGQGVYMDVLARTVEFGGYGACDNYGWKLSAAEYRSTMTDTAMFSMPDDNFKTISIPWALQYTGRFDTSAVGNLSPLHRTIAKNARSLAAESKLALTGNAVDMFVFANKTLNDTTWTDVTHYGHMEPWALSPTIIRNHARTMRLFLERNMMATAVKALYDGDKSRMDLLDLPLTPTDFQWAQIAQPAPIGGSLVAAGHYTGGPLLPTVQALGAANPVWVQPPVGTWKTRFLGSPSAQFTLAKSDPAAHPYIDPAVFEGARDFLTGVQAMKAAFVEIYGADHPMLDPAYAPLAFRSPMPGSVGEEWDSLATFAHNMFGATIGNVHGEPLAPLLFQNWVPARNGAPAGAQVLIPGFVFGAVPDQAPYAASTISNLTAQLVATSPNVRETFGSANNVIAFAERFNASPLGPAYIAYVAQKRREQRDPVIQVVPITNAFLHFFDNEVVTRLDAATRADYDNGVDNPKAAYVIGRILAHVIPQVARGVDFTFSKAGLDALASGFEAYAATSGAIAGDSTGDYYITRLVASPARVYDLQQANAALANRIVVSSSINPSLGAKSPQVVADALRQQQAADPYDLSNRTIATMAAPVRRPEVRRPLQMASGTQPYTPFADIAQDVVTDAFGRSTLKTNQNMLARIVAAKRETNVLQRVSALMLITAPVQSTPVKAMYEENVVMPFAVLCARPRRSYRTVGMIWLAINDTVGMAAYALPDVRRGLDASRKSMFDHWSMYLGAVVVDPARIMLMPDVAIVGYNSGETIDAVIPQAIDDMQENSSVAQGSMYYILMPAGSLWGAESTISPTMSITGRFPHQLTQYLPGDQASIEFLNKARSHFSSALFNNVLHNLAPLNHKQLPHELMYQKANDQRANVVIARELQMIDFGTNTTTAVPPADLIAKNVYPGIAKQRTTGNFPEISTGDAHAHTVFLTE